MVCVTQVYYEVHILEHLPAEFGDDHQEMDPHVVRVGWSIDSSSFQLGDNSVRVRVTVSVKQYCVLLKCFYHIEVR